MQETSIEAIKKYVLSCYDHSETISHALNLSEEAVLVLIKSTEGVKTYTNKKFKNILNDTTYLTNPIELLSDLSIDIESLSTNKKTIFTPIPGALAKNTIFAWQFESFNIHTTVQALVLTASKADTLNKKMESFFSSVFDFTSDCILIANNQGKYIDANESALEIFGYSKEEFLKLSVVDIVFNEKIQSIEYSTQDPETSEQTTSKNQETLWAEFMEQGSQKGIISCKTKSGQIIRMRYHAISNVWPGFHFSILHELNVAERIQANINKREEKSAALFKIFPDLLFILDKEGNFMDFIAGDIKSLYRNPQEFMHKNIAEVLPPDVVNEFRQAVSKLIEENTSQKFEYSLNIDKQLLHYEATLVLQNNEKVLLLAREIANNNPLVYKDPRLESKHKAILSTIQQTALVINHEGVIVEILSKEQTKADFIDQCISKKNLFDVFKEKEAQRHLGHIQQSIDQGESLNYEFLNTRNEMDQIFIVRVCPINQNEAVVVIKDISVQREKELKLYQTQKILEATLNNTQQSFTIVGEDYLIKAYNKVARDNALLFFGRPLEEGQPITYFVLERDKEAFFHDFDKALKGEKVSTERSFIGKNNEIRWLSFTYSLIDISLDGKRLVVLNVMDISQQKIFENKLIENNLDLMTTKPEDHQNLSFSANILVVEDKTTNQLVLKLILEKVGCKVDIAINGSEALLKYKPADHHLIIMDIQMPVMDGVTALKELKKQHKSLCPIIALSAGIAAEGGDKYINYGFDDYLGKPYTPKQMAQKLIKWIPDTIKKNN